MSAAAISLRDRFLDAVTTRPAALALVVNEREWSYEEVEDEARRLARVLVDELDHTPRRVGVFAARSGLSYTGTLAALLSGAAFVPLNPTFPPRRTKEMIARSDLDAILVDRASSPQLEEILSGLPTHPLVVFGENGATAPLAARVVPHSKVLAAQPLMELPNVAVDDIAYLLFTSGSTGLPKGVGVTHRNVLHFLGVVQERYGFRETDRFSQTFDRTFDLSVFDVFAAWSVGASVHVPARVDLLAPQRYVNAHSLTVWFSVPSIVALMRQKRFLRVNCMPSLRWSLFCGEALPNRSATEWHSAAPNALLENLYGPTELTIACTAYRWHHESSDVRTDDIVPIGSPFPGLTAVVLDERLQVLPPGATGEFCLAGPQTVPGYWKDLAQTADRFVELRQTKELAAMGRFYRTGDLVRQRPDGVYEFRGRVDQQVKILGHRVELGEVEAVLCRDPSVLNAAALPWPIEEGIGKGVMVFVSGANIDVQATVERLRQQLPSYMVPSRVEVIENMPLNANGKIDRAELGARLKATT